MNGVWSIGGRSACRSLYQNSSDALRQDNISRHHCSNQVRIIRLELRNIADFESNVEPVDRVCVVDHYRHPKQHTGGNDWPVENGSWGTAVEVDWLCSANHRWERWCPGLWDNLGCGK